MLRRAGLCCLEHRLPGQSDEVRAAKGPVRPARGTGALLEVEAGKTFLSDEARLDESGVRGSCLPTKADGDQNGSSPRRVEGDERVSYEILTPMGSPKPSSDRDSNTPEASPSGISEFIARVLAQLTLSAWLPAAFLTASIAVLLQFRSSRSADILGAVRKLTTNPIQVLVLIIPLLVIATVVTQAFSFEAIRTLEGYWPGRGIVSLARTLMIRRHIRKKRSIAKRRIEESVSALGAAMPAMLMSGIPFPIVKALEAYFSGKEPPQLTSEEQEVVLTTEWRNWCEPWRLAKVDHLSKQEERYPDSFRILPTKLGNLLRATEDKLSYAAGDLQGYALQRYDMVSRQVQIQHDVYRTRLEMYCTLVFVSASLVLLTPVVLLDRVDVVAIVVTAVSFAVMSIVSYIASLASADGYCFALRQMDSVPAAANPT